MVRSRILALGTVAAMAAASMVTAFSGPATADHSFTMSDGVYRIPYANGTNVTVSRDHHDHAPAKDRIDMGAGAGSTIVAAASGIIRAVVDFNGNSPGAGDGVDKAGNPQDDSLEHSCQDDQDMNGNPIPDSVVTGLCQEYNNYVWIEHPNGEWTKYTHFGTGTVTANGWAVGMTINAGDVLGTENDVGAASGPHLHFEVAIPTDPNDPTPFSTLGGFIQGVNVVPYVCDIPNNIYVSGGAYTAADCVSLPAPAICSASPAPGPGAIIALPGAVTVGTAGPDVIYGTAGPDRIAGLGGADVIFGGGGDDELSGGEDADTICGGVGNDS
ncbi:MAG: peptidoglycan DD-metalloendopeptidase family protein, partial [Actinobacteria bacterium]|nr:peptidoglycan DD-metalloendopeptidase family protein [Actinomycetota bacterium]